MHLYVSKLTIYCFLQSILSHKEFSVTLKFLLKKKQTLPLGSFSYFFSFEGETKHEVRSGGFCPS